MERGHEQRRTQVVFGDANPGAGIMFAGEGPDAKEDPPGLPFASNAGRPLTFLLDTPRFINYRDQVKVLCWRELLALPLLRLAAALCQPIYMKPFREDSRQLEQVLKSDKPIQERPVA